MHTCNPNYSGDRGRRIRVQGKLPGQKRKTLSGKKKKEKVLGPWLKW
jgi:hypothetical protein